MNTPNSQSKIKPILAHTICIQNLYKYNDFFRRRYKQTLNFKFKCPEKAPPVAQLQNMTTQIRLYKILKHLKILNKADLSHAKLSNHFINPSRTLSIFKQITQTPTISIITICNPLTLSIEKWPRILPKLRNLQYELSQGINPSQLTTKINNPLKNLKLCTKLQSLDIRAPFIDHKLSHYPTSLKRLSITPDSPSDSILENFHHLESIHFTINSQSDLNKIFIPLSKLPDLQEVSLEPLNLNDVHFSPYFPQIASFKKLKLDIECTLSFDSFGLSTNSGRPHILKTLENFHNLTYLSLTLSISSDIFIGSLFSGLKNQSQLQSLKLIITNGMYFQNHKILQLLCQEISTLGQLQHLKLSFEGNNVPQGHKLSDFLPDLTPAFNKPVKIKTFSFECSQLTPGDVYFSLIDLLETSRDSLEKLKIEIGEYCYQKKDHHTALFFFKGLVNIRKLEIPDLIISDKKFLNDFTEIVLQYKYLRVLEIGTIKSTVSKPGFYLAVESILKKRGLEEFQYSVQDDFMNTLKAKSKNDKQISLNQVRRNNPSLENMPKYISLFEDDISDKNW